MQEQIQPIQEKKSRWWIWLVVLIIILGIGGGTVYYFSQPRVISETSEEVITCSDSDGEDIYKKGIASYTFEDPNEPGEIPRGTIEDWCEYSHPKTDEKIGLIREGYCEDEKLITALMTCGWGYVCRDGACVKQDKNSAVCIDNDYGKDYNKKGDIVGYGGTGTDSCWTSFNSNPELDGGYGPECAGEGCYIYEYYCEGNNKEHEIVSCPNGCNNGACIK